MAVTRTNTKTSQGANGLPLTSTYTITGYEEVNYNNPLAPTATGTYTTVPIQFAYANLGSVYIIADQNCILKFNNSTTGVPQVNLTAGQPFMWDYTQNGQITGASNPFTADITTLYFQSGTGVTANTNLQISVLLGHS